MENTEELSAESTKRKKPEHPAKEVPSLQELSIAQCLKMSGLSFPFSSAYIDNIIGLNEANIYIVFKLLSKYHREFALQRFIYSDLFQEDKHLYTIIHKYVSLWLYDNHLTEASDNFNLAFDLIINKFFARYDANGEAKTIKCFLENMSDEFGYLKKSVNIQSLDNINFVYSHGRIQYQESLKPNIIKLLKNVNLFKDKSNYAFMLACNFGMLDRIQEEWGKLDKSEREKPEIIQVIESNVFSALIGENLDLVDWLLSQLDDDSRSKAILNGLEAVEASYSLRAFSYLWSLFDKKQKKVLVDETMEAMCTDEGDAEVEYKKAFGNAIMLLSLCFYETPENFKEFFALADDDKLNAYLLATFSGYSGEELFCFSHPHVFKYFWEMASEETQGKTKKLLFKQHSWPAFSDILHVLSCAEGSLITREALLKDISENATLVLGKKKGATFEKNMREACKIIFSNKELNTGVLDDAFEAMTKEFRDTHLSNIVKEIFKHNRLSLYQTKKLFGFLEGSPLLQLKAEEKDEIFNIKTDLISRQDNPKHNKDVDYNDLNALYDDIRWENGSRKPDVRNLSPYQNNTECLRIMFYHVAIPILYELLREVSDENLFAALDSDILNRILDPFIFTEDLQLIPNKNLRELLNQLLIKVTDTNQSEEASQEFTHMLQLMIEFYYSKENDPVVLQFKLLSAFLKECGDSEANNKKVTDFFEKFQNPVTNKASTSKIENLAIDALRELKNEYGDNPKHAEYFQPDGLNNNNEVAQRL